MADSETMHITFPVVDTRHPPLRGNLFSLYFVEARFVFLTLLGEAVSLTLFLDLSFLIAHF